MKLSLLFLFFKVEAEKGWKSVEALEVMGAAIRVGETLDGGSWEQKENN